MSTLDDKRILLIITGGIAAYKSLDLIRRLRERGARVRCVMTEGAQQFVTAMAAAALSEEPVFTDLWSLKEESEMGHIRLSREADLLLVAPASADFLARMAAGLANDLATTVLLATDKPVLTAPAMNLHMWSHAATRANVALLDGRGILRIGPGSGDLACGEVGSGRMAEPLEIVAAVEHFFSVGHADPAANPGRDSVGLHGFSALVTSGPTWEPIDPVRFLGNRSSGKQGHAIAAALAAAGADTVLVSGPSAEPVPPNVRLIRIETAQDLLHACVRTLPVDIAVCAAAVADWRVEHAAGQKLKKGEEGPPTLMLVENPDILHTLSQPSPNRPRLVVGFAAETDHVVAHARAKRLRKGCDWILANDVSADTGIFGGERSEIVLIDEAGEEAWPSATKTDIARRLVLRIAAHLKQIRAADERE